MGSGPLPEAAAAAARPIGRGWQRWAFFRQQSAWVCLGPQPEDTCLATRPCHFLDHHATPGLIECLSLEICMLPLPAFQQFAAVTPRQQVFLLAAAAGDSSLASGRYFPH